MQKARSQQHRRLPDGPPPTACKHVVSGSLSLPAQGCFSPVPHGTRPLSVTQESLALEGGPPSFSQGFSCPDLLDTKKSKDKRYFVYQAVTVFGAAFQLLLLASLDLCSSGKPLAELTHRTDFW